MIRNTLGFVLLLTGILAASGCSASSDSLSGSQSNLKGQANSYDTTATEKVKQRFDMLFEGTDILRYEFENETGTAVSMYVTSALSGGSVQQKTQFVNTVVEGVRTATGELSTRNITIYFKLASTKKLIYAFENGKFINYE